jgi:hypothetical protein
MSMSRHCCCCDYHYYVDSEDLEAVEAVEAEIFYQAEAVEVAVEKMT